jgi:hypothetical protein
MPRAVVTGSIPQSGLDLLAEGIARLADRTGST